MILKRALYWGLPALLCVALYWHGLKAWFQMDDFAWLSLHTQVRDFSTLISALFRPMAQGTVRPLSERLFFLAFWQLFGMDALPYRLLVFATQLANLALLSAIVRRLTGSAVAGFVAPVLWLASPVLYLPMVWTSAYNQILSCFFLLAAFLFLLRYIDTDRTRDYIAIWIAFLAGFGALELNVVFPAIACLYTMLFAPRRLRAVAPMFAVSIAFAIWHRSLAQSVTSGVYAMDYSLGSLAVVFGKYMWLLVSGTGAARLHGLSETPFVACAIAVLVGLAVFIGLMAWKRRWLVLFFTGWFVLTLAPYLPLANHVSDYYLTAPAIGIAMLGGWGIWLAMKSRPAVRVIAVLLVLMFAVPGAWHAWSLTEWYSAKSRRVRGLVRGVAAAHARHPNRWIVLHGVDEDLFWNGLYDRPETAFGWRPLYVTAEMRPMISPVLEEDISHRFLPAAVTIKAIQRGEAVVYDVSGGRLRNITAPYLRLRALSEEATAVPRAVDAANPLFASFLKDGWHGDMGGLRWTSQRAAVVVGGAAERASSLRLHGRVTEAHTAVQPLVVSVSVDGVKAPPQTIGRGVVEFDLKFPLPSDAAGKRAMLVSIETDRAVSFGTDSRQFGLGFGTIAVVSPSKPAGVR